MPRELLGLWLLIVAAACLAAGCGGKMTAALPQQGATAPVFDLPALDQLPAPSVPPSKRSAGAAYQLGETELIAVSGNGSATHVAGELILDPALNAGLAWAVYALAGLPSDGTEYPLNVAVAKDTTPLWMGASDFGRDAWEFRRLTPPGATDLHQGADLVSAEGVFYVALIAADSALTIASVTVNTYVFVPGGDFRELLIVYNSDIPEDLALANYYGSEETGRGIDPEYRIGLQLGADAGQSISRENYGTLIRDPIISFLGSHPAIAEKIKYLLLMKGVPHKIEGYEDLDASDGITTTCSAVDSELCTLYSGGVSGGDGSYPIVGWLWNGASFEQPPSSAQTFLEGETDFIPHYYKVTDSANAQYDLDYLVGRLTAYTYAEAKQAVDRSLAADTTGTGWILFDSSDALIGDPGVPMYIYDTMVDPVYPYGDPMYDSGFELFDGAGYNVIADVTTAHITADWPYLPLGAADNVIAYCSWGQHAGHVPVYILETLGFSYRPGACFMSYESFNANDFDDSDGVQRRGQGQIADFLRVGGTVCLGNAWEPFDRGIGDERWVYWRYLYHGDRWIEAAYKGMRTLSWQGVVVGDPLCRVVE